jgi:hypothetical protein
MRSKHDNIEVVGATASDDLDAIQAFRTKSGADYPILYGMSAETAQAYGVKDYPYFVVLESDGSIAGSGEAVLEHALEG